MALQEPCLYLFKYRPKILEWETIQIPRIVISSQHKDAKQDDILEKQRSAKNPECCIQHIHDTSVSTRQEDAEKHVELLRRPEGCIVSST